jgi:hypothetical protein
MGLSLPIYGQLSSGEMAEVLASDRPAFTAEVQPLDTDSPAETLSEPDTPEIPPEPAKSPSAFDPIESESYEEVIAESVYSDEFEPEEDSKTPSDFLHDLDKDTFLEQL